MRVLVFFLYIKVKALLNIICDLNEKTNLLIRIVVSPVNYLKRKLKILFNYVSKSVLCAFEYINQSSIRISSRLFESINKDNFIVTGSRFRIGTKKVSELKCFLLLPIPAMRFLLQSLVSRNFLAF